MENNIYQWVLKYRKHGWSCFPVGKDKRPLVEWKKYQTEYATEAQLKEWFDKPDAPNIGVATGKISNLTVVDVENGGNWQDLPVTMTSKTGNGGYHLFYRYAPSVGNSVRIRPLTDIRGEGGFVVVSPSKTDYLKDGQKSGGTYEWVRKEDEQPFPYQMFKLSPEKNTDWEKLLTGTQAGSRNETAAKVIGKFLTATSHKDWTTVAWDMTVLWNQRNKPPLDEKELRATFNSIIATRVRSGNINDADSKDLNAITKEQEDCDIKLISEIAQNLSDDITISYPTGYKEYDNAFMGGVKEGDLIVLSGHTGQGKTLFMQSLAYNFEKSGQPILFFSFEVPIGELWRKFKDMKVENNFLAYAPEKNTNRRIDWVCEKVREARDRFKRKIVFIDHLGFLMEEPANYDASIANNLSTILTIITRRLKSLAIQENVVIILAHHLRKAPNSKESSTVHDLKDSAGVGQEADAIVFVRRKVKKMGYEETGDTYENESIISIEKNRRTGTSKKFEVSYQKGRLVQIDEALQGIIAKGRVDNDKDLQNFNYKS